MFGWCFLVFFDSAGTRSKVSKWKWRGVFANSEQRRDPTNVRKR